MPLFCAAVTIDVQYFALTLLRVLICFAVFSSTPMSSAKSETEGHLLMMSRNVFMPAVYISYRSMQQLFRRNVPQMYLWCAA
jgi:hypothetical protein